jgi:hypothetical protein
MVPARRPELADPLERMGGGLTVNGIHAICRTFNVQRNIFQRRS